MSFPFYALSNTYPVASCKADRYRSHSNMILPLTAQPYWKNVTILEMILLLYCYYDRAKFANN